MGYFTSAPKSGYLPCAQPRCSSNYNLSKHLDQQLHRWFAKYSSTIPCEAKLNSNEKTREGKCSTRSTPTSKKEIHKSTPANAASGTELVRGSGLSLSPFQQIAHSSPPLASSTNFIELLPMDVLLLITKFMDPPTLALFCQSSRALRHLYPVFEPDPSKREPCEWSLINRAQFRKAIVGRKELCTACRQFEKTKQCHRLCSNDPNLVRAIHCSACKSDHPQILFTPHQRHVCSCKRICRIQEGGMLLCEHKIVRFHDISTICRRWPKTRYRLCRESIENICCSHPSHLIPVTKSQLASPAAWWQRWKQRPKITVKPRRWDYVDIHLRRTADLLTLGPGEILTVARLRAALDDLAKEGRFYLCPHRDVNDISITTCTPARCPCIVTPSGRFHLPTGIHAQQSFPGFVNKGFCRNKDDWSFPIKTEARDKYLEAMKKKNQLNSKGKPKATFHAVFKQCCRGIVRIFLDPTSPRVIRIEYELNTYVHTENNTPDDTWLSHVDPLSFGVLNEPELKHHVWCGDVNCVRYYKKMNISIAYTSQLKSTVKWTERCACNVPFWVMSPSQYDLRYDPNREEEELNHDTYYDEPSQNSISWYMRSQ